MRTILFKLITCVIALTANAQDLRTNIPLPSVDSASMKLGAFMGDAWAVQAAKTEGAGKISKEAFMRGFNAVVSPQISATDSASYVMGVKAGAQMLEIMNSTKIDYGVEVDRRRVVRSFQGRFNADTDHKGLDIEQAYTRFATEMRQFKRQIADHYADIGRRYIAEKVAREQYETTRSGIAYKTIVEGDSAEEEFRHNQVVAATYVLKHLDGKVIARQDQDTSIWVSNRALIPAFYEALLMMKPGSTMDFVAPAGEAYGMTGNEALNIMPGEALAFTIHVTKLLKDSPKVQPRKTTYTPRQRSYSKTKKKGRVSKSKARSSKKGKAKMSKSKSKKKSASSKKRSSKKRSRRR